MRVISLRRLREFWEAGHADAQGPLRAWYQAAIDADWNSLDDVRRTYPKTDAVRAGEDLLLVFNIKGNKYRLIVRTRFEWQLMNIRDVLTHADYNKGTWKS